MWGHLSGFLEGGLLQPSHKRINKEDLAGWFDAKFIAAWFVFWTVRVLLNVGGNRRPFRSTLVFRERVWKEIKAVRLPA